MIISRTPYRISFFGGGTDYPAWFTANGGAVLSTTIDKYCYLTCRYLPPFFEHRIRVVHSKIENCHSVEEIGHPAVREVLRYLNIDRGLEIHHDGDLPARSGVGSSSSFVVGLLHALYALKGEMPSKRKLAIETLEIEQVLLQETVGSQDQFSAAYGGFNQMIFPKGDGEIQLLPMTLPAARIQELNDHLMLFYTGILRTSSDIASTYVDDLEARHRQLISIGQMVDAGVSVLSDGHDLNRFGQLLHEGWDLKRSLGSLVTNSEVDEIYESAKSAGAVGGKLLGAGGGGFMLLFVPPAKQSQVRERLSKLISVPFKFESMGSQIILFDQEMDYSAEDQSRASRENVVFRELVTDEAASDPSGRH